MARKRHTVEQIIAKLREAEIALAQGQSVGEVCRKIEVTEQTYYRWRKEYSGMRIERAKRLKVLEKENARLKRLNSSASAECKSTISLRSHRGEHGPGAPGACVYLEHGEVHGGPGLAAFERLAAALVGAERVEPLAHPHRAGFRRSVAGDVPGGRQLQQ